MERFQFATLQALLTGMVFAAAVLETLGLITYERIGFGLLFRRGKMGLLAVPLLFMTAPVIILKDAFSQRMRSGGWLLLGLGLMVALFWAIASGHVLLRIIEIVMPAAFVK